MASSYPPYPNLKDTAMGSALELHQIPSLASSSKGGNTMDASKSTSADNIELTPLPDSQTVLRSATRSSQVDIIAASNTDEVSPELQKRYRRNGLIQFTALCWFAFLIGWNDGTTGPLIPRMQVDYKLDDLVVSLLFVATAIVRVSSLSSLFAHDLKDGAGTHCRCHRQCVVERSDWFRKGE
jgi:hypothetical protein